MFISPTSSFPSSRFAQPRVELDSGQMPAPHPTPPTPMKPLVCPEAPLEGARQASQTSMTTAEAAPAAHTSCLQSGALPETRWGKSCLRKANHSQSVWLQPHGGCAEAAGPIVRAGSGSGCGEGSRPRLGVVRMKELKKVSTA